MINSVFPSNNGDGIKLTSRDGQAELVVAGGNNAGFILKDYCDMCIKEFKSKVEYKTIGDNWFVISFKKNGKICYLKMFVGINSHNAFALTYPESQKTEYDEMVVKLEKSFRPGEINQAW